VLRTALAFLFVTHTVFAARVLLLNSYHQGYEWTDVQVQGILTAIKSNSSEHEVYVEYLDARRTVVESQDDLAAMFAKKYEGRPPDVVIATDDIAIHFLLDRPSLFSKAPIIVSGANDHRDSSRYLHADHGREIAGVLETFDPIGTINVALALQPQTKNIVTVGEIDDVDYASAIAASHPELRVWRLRAQQLSADELAEQLRKLPADTVVLFSVFSSDGRKRLYTIQQSTQFVTQQSTAPVYSLNKNALGFGIVGGKLTDGFLHGHTAGEIAAAVIGGKKPAEIGLQKSPNRFLFDDAQLRRWRLDRSRLPIGSETINEPKSLVREHWRLALTIFFCIAAQALIIAMLVVSRRRQRRVRMELAASETRFRNLANAMPQIIWVADAVGSINYFNEKWRAYTGIDATSADVRDWMNAIHPDDREASRNTWEMSAKAGSVYEIEHRLKGAAGTFRWHLTRALPVRLQDHLEWFGTSTDIDDQKRVEADLRSANHDLEQFAYSASHDLQEPLRMVSIYCQLLERRHGARLEGESAIYLRYVLQGANRMNQLLQDLLSYTRMALSDRDPAAECDTALVLKGVIADLQPRIIESGASVMIKSPMPLISAADVHVQQVFQNLLSNGLKYRSDQPPAISISATALGHRWRFAVQDNGIGIAPVYHDRIFGLFRRLHGQAEYAGTGLGLALCQRIISRYGGEIWVESDAGAGSTFLFTFPAFVPKSEGNGRAVQAEAPGALFQ